MLGAINGCGQLLEIILPFFPGTIPKLYGMLRTMVIAGKASHAPAIVSPFRITTIGKPDVIHWAFLCTFSASQAFIHLDAEGLVCDEPFSEYPSK